MVLVRAGGATFGAYLSDPLTPVLSVDQYSDESNFYIHTYTHTYIHTYIHTYMRIHAYTHAKQIQFLSICTFNFLLLITHMYVNSIEAIHTHIYSTYLHTYIHTHTYTHTADDLWAGSPACYLFSVQLGLKIPFHARSATSQVHSFIHTIHTFIHTFSTYIHF